MWWLIGGASVVGEVAERFLGDAEHGGQRVVRGGRGNMWASSAISGRTLPTVRSPDMMRPEAAPPKTAI